MNAKEIAIRLGVVQLIIDDCLGKADSGLMVKSRSHPEHCKVMIEMQCMVTRLTRMQFAMNYPNQSAQNKTMSP